MSALAIQARGLGKQYFIRSRRESSLSGQVLSWFGAGGGTRPLWAARNIDLSIARGESVGLIGPNGAGKSTLLMLLAGLISPTEGRLELRGRVSPFLKLGAGLFPELTVLDNVRLAGVLFGLTRRETARRLDAIVAFGGLSDYLYARLGELSSGYQARVIFSTALHSDIDILLVDEVFGVGDAAFRRVCLERMEGLRREGRTIVLATHDLELVKRFCSRALYLSQGRVQQEGEPAVVTASYRAASAA